MQCCRLALPLSIELPLALVDCLLQALFVRRLRLGRGFSLGGELLLRARELFGELLLRLLLMRAGRQPLVGEAPLFVALRLEPLQLLLQALLLARL